MNFRMYSDPELSLKFHISKQSMFRITSITEKHMKVKTLLSFAAALCCAAAFSMSAQAQLKNSPMHANLPDNATTKDCLVCHQSYQTVAQRTAKMNPNPHSNHRGEQNCTNCHSVKGKPHLECNDCHTFAIKMKGE